MTNYNTRSADAIQEAIARAQSVSNDGGGDSAMTADWTSSDWASDYTSEFGG